ncbi:MAG: hypothetical protein Q9190_007868 [Brigantiaea leucoxantha]
MARRLQVTVVDVADWSGVVEKLYSCIGEAPPISKYASAAARAANRPLAAADRFGVEFVRQDVLDMDEGRLRVVFEGAALVTIMFTLNELYSSSIPATSNFLLSLTRVLAPGARLLVVDSSGSYSTVRLSKSSTTTEDLLLQEEQKTYPMHWLLDHTLLEIASEDRGKQWTKLKENKSRWFRLADKLSFPNKLEDVRMQVHLYRRT